MTSQHSGSDQPQTVGRRQFISTGASTLAAASAMPAHAVEPRAESAADKVVVGVMGLSRGLSLAKTFAALPDVEVRYLCDVDERRLKAAGEAMKSVADNGIQLTADFRRILDDDDVDALICAAPNHWHAPAGILACKAGKHCYVEKPCSHNPWEGEMLLAAARKYDRCVQMGTQRRSAEKISKAIGFVHEGRIGRVYYSRSWYANLRGPIGQGTVTPVPAHVDYENWQGPAPRQDYTSNRLPYNWHWVWHYGNGELGNNGVHSMDLSRWGLQVDYPTRVVSSGGRYRFDDDQQTADTHVVSFEFEDDKQMIWEGLSCNRMGLNGSTFGVSFHGEEGSITLDSWGYRVFDQRGKEVESETGRAADSQHAANFVDAIRQSDPTLLNAEIEEAYKSTLLCHLGNIAHRTGDSLKCDPGNGHIMNSEAAAKLWKRDYAPGWEPTL
ncbi:MAG: Gfo/Idh/MocA family oxidoreductase [Planctomycetaceae bacterium]|nr:Gfo/Idh/MocA family oxidoreductase [Planctomycetaceae bacterium]